jgi:hypothetical protein
MKAPQIIIGVVAALALAGGGFAAGMTVERNNTAAEASRSASPSGAVGRGGQGGAGGFVGRGGAGASGVAGQQILAGRVLSVNDGSITLEVRQPGGQGASPSVSSQIVLVGTSTRVVKTTEQEIKLSDLKANDQIQIIAATDANGQISANAIIAGGNALQQLFGGPGGGGPGGRGASPSPSPTR